MSSPSSRPNGIDLCFRPGRFIIDGLPGPYDGFTRDETWNGWAVPYFPLAEARRIADDCAAQPEGIDGKPDAEYDHDRSVIRIYEPANGEWEEYGSVTGWDVSLYPVGSFYWTWEESD